MNFDGDSLRRKDGVTIISIEQDGSEDPEYVINYLNEKNIGFARLSFSLHFKGYSTVENGLEISHLGRPEMLMKLEEALIEKRKVNLVIVSEGKENKRAFIKKIEFPAI